MHQPSPTPLLTEAEVLRKLNVGQHRATKLRRAGVLVPDYTAENGFARLYQPGRLATLAAAVQQSVASSTANVQS